MEVLVCRTRVGTLSLRALTSLTQPVLPSVAIWSRVFDVSRPPCPTLNRGGETTVESLGLSAPQEKVGTCRRKEKGEVGEFKQACLIDVSVLSPVRAVL